MNNTQLYLSMMLTKYLADFNDTRLVLSVFDKFEIDGWEPVLALRKCCISDKDWQIFLGFEIPMEPNIKGAEEIKSIHR